MTYRRTRKRRITAASSDEFLARYVEIKRRFSCYLLDGVDEARPSDADIAWFKWYAGNFHTEGDKAGQKIGTTKRPGFPSNVARFRRVPRT